MQQNELPEGWANTRLFDITLNVKNVKPENEPDRDFKYIDISSIDNRRFVISEYKEFKGRDAPSRARRPIKTNDVLFSNVRTYLKNIAIVGEEYDNQLCSTGFTVLRPSIEVLPKYLFIFVQTDEFIDSVTPQQRGSQYPATSDTVVKAAQIPLPPLPEQHRIVAAIEALFARLDATNERLDRVPGIMKGFRQAVLVAACDGRLTEDWRLKNSDIESATAIIEYIVTEKNHISKKRQIEDAFCEIPYEVPINWCWTCIESISESMKNGIYKPQEFYSDDGIACLRMYNIDNGKIVWKNIKRMNLSSEEIAEYILEPGDILVNRVNSRELVGKAAPIPNGIEPCIYESKNIRLKVFKQYVLSEYIGFWFQVYAQGYFNINAQQTVNMASINQHQLASMPLPLPPLPEQQEIVRRVDALFAFADSIEAKVAAAMEKTERLRQSILAKAFSGELVPTEAELSRQEGRNYESAEMLLERIKREGMSGKK